MKQYNQTIRGKLFKYFQDRLGLKKSTKGWWRADCPYCGGRFTFGIHLENYKVKCFKCDHYSNPMSLLMYLEGFEQFNQATNFLNIQQEYEAYERLNRSKENREVKHLELPESFLLLIHGDSMMGKAARYYMKKRGYDITKLSLMGVGYCTSGPYTGYIVFPYYRKGKLVYFQGRRYMGSGPKMKNPEEEVYGIGKSSLIYNEDALFIYKKIYTLESITNSLTLGDNTIGLSGKKISPTQYSKILSSPCEKIIIGLDPDAYDEAIKLAMQLVHFKRVKVLKLPDEKDVNDIGKKATKEIEKVTPYSNYMDLLKLKNSLNEGTEPAYQRVRPNYNSTRGVL